MRLNVTNFEVTPKLEKMTHFLVRYAFVLPGTIEPLLEEHEDEELLFVSGSGYTSRQQAVKRMERSGYHQPRFGYFSKVFTAKQLLASFGPIELKEEGSRSIQVKKPVLKATSELV